MAMVIVAVVFSWIYLVELFLFGIGAFKEGAGRGLAYCFLAAILILWASFFLIRKKEFRYKIGAFVTFGLALSLWVIPAWRVELAVERYEDQKTINIQRRIEVFNVTDEPLLTSGGKPIGIRMKYSVRFPEAGVYPPAPILAAADEHFKGQMMRVVGAQIIPSPRKILSDPNSTGTHARYQSGVVYAFVVDLVPSFLIMSRDRAKSCFSFFDANEKNIIASSDLRTRYTVHIDGTDYGGYLGGAPRYTQND